MTVFLTVLVEVKMVDHTILRILLREYPAGQTFCLGVLHKTRGVSINKTPDTMLSLRE